MNRVDILAKFGKVKKMPQLYFMLVLWCSLSTTYVVFGSLAHRARPTSELFGFGVCSLCCTVSGLGVSFNARGYLSVRCRTAIFFVLTFRER